METLALASGLRLWLDLAPDASRELLWSAREGYAAVQEALHTSTDALDLVTALLAVASDGRERELVSEALIEEIERRHLYMYDEVFLRSDDEPWATLHDHLNDSDKRIGYGSPANVSQVAVAYNWMAANWPGERERNKEPNRWNAAASHAVDEIERSPRADPIPLLSALVRACRTDEDIFYIAAGPFETVLRNRPEHRGAIEKMARADSEWTEVLHGVWVDQKTAREMSDFLRAAVIVLEN